MCARVYFILYVVAFLAPPLPLSLFLSLYVCYYTLYIEFELIKCERKIGLDCVNSWFLRCC